MWNACDLHVSSEQILSVNRSKHCEARWSTYMWVKYLRGSNIRRCMFPISIPSMLLEKHGDVGLDSDSHDRITIVQLKLFLFKQPFIFCNSSSCSKETAHLPRWILMTVKLCYLESGTVQNQRPSARNHLYANFIIGIHHTHSVSCSCSAP